MDPDLTRLLAIPGEDDLTLEDVADVFKVSSRTVARAVQRGQLGAKRHPGRGAGVRRSVLIPRTAALAYLVRITQGDRADLMEDIARRCPKTWLAVALRAAAPKPAPVPADAKIKTLSKAPQDPFQGHTGDLFSSLHPSA